MIAKAALVVSRLATPTIAEIQAWPDRLNSPFRTAEAYNFDEISDPRDTRRLLCEYAALRA